MSQTNMLAAYVVHVVDPLNFSAFFGSRSDLTKKLKEIQEFEEDLDSYGKAITESMDQPPDITELNVRQQILARCSQMDGRWLRAIVVSVNSELCDDDGDDEVDVFFEDYRLSEFVSTKDIIVSIPDDVINQPCLFWSCQQCRLHGIEPIDGSWNPKAVAYFSEQVLLQLVEVKLNTSVEGQATNVTIFIRNSDDVKSETSIQEVLIGNGWAQLCEKAKSRKVVEMNESLADDHIPKLDPFLFFSTPAINLSQKKEELKAPIEINFEEEEFRRTNASLGIDDIDRWEVFSDRKICSGMSDIAEKEDFHPISKQEVDSALESMYKAKCQENDYYSSRKYPKKGYKHDVAPGASPGRNTSRKEKKTSHAASPTSSANQKKEYNLKDLASEFLKVFLDNHRSEELRIMAMQKLMEDLKGVESEKDLLERCLDTIIDFCISDSVWLHSTLELISAFEWNYEDFVSVLCNLITKFNTRYVKIVSSSHFQNACPVFCTLLAKLFVLSKYWKDVNRSAIRKCIKVIVEKWVFFDLQGTGNCNSQLLELFHSCLGIVIGVIAAENLQLLSSEFEDIMERIHEKLFYPKLSRKAKETLLEIILEVDRRQVETDRRSKRCVDDETQTDDDWHNSFEMHTGPGSTCDSTFKVPRVPSFAEINSARSCQEDNAYGSYKADSPFHPNKEEINHSNSSRISSDDDAKLNAVDSYDETFPPLAATVQSSSSSTSSRASKSSSNPTSFSFLANSLLKDTLVHASISESSVIQPDLNNRQNMERYRSSASNTPVIASSPLKSTNVEVKKKFGTKKAIPSKDFGDATSRFGEILVCTNCSESSHRAKDCPMKSTIKFY